MRARALRSPIRLDVKPRGPEICSRRFGNSHSRHGVRNEGERRRSGPGGTALQRSAISQYLQSKSQIAKAPKQERGSCPPTASISTVLAFCAGYSDKR